MHCFRVVEVRGKERRCQGFKHGTLWGALGEARGYTIPERAQIIISEYRDGSAGREHAVADWTVEEAQRLWDEKFKSLCRKGRDAMAGGVTR